MPSRTLSLWPSAVGEIDKLPDDTFDAIKAKELEWASFEAGERQLARLRANAWCAAFVLPKREWTIQFTDGVWHTLVDDPASASQPVLDAIEDATARFSFLHWHFAFPDVMAKGGFDVVMGNPPWDQVQFDDREFFVTRVPEIAKASSMAKRKKLLDELQTVDPLLYNAYTEAAAQLDAIKHFIHASGRYPLTSYGRLNWYSLFTELDYSVVSASGRVGIVVPTGIATDAFNQFLIRDLLEGGAVASLYDFENKGILPAVHSSYKFCLLTLSGRTRAVAPGADLAFFCHQVSDLEDSERRFRLSAEDVAVLNPNTRTLPVFRSRRDVEITLGIYRRVPVLIHDNEPKGNDWGIRSLLMFMMNTDSGLFRSSEELKAEGFKLNGNVFRRGSETYLPLYEGKMVDHFDHRAADVVMSATATARQRQPRYLSMEEHQDPARQACPQAWVDEHEVDSRLPDWSHQWLLGYSNVTSSTNWRTVVGGIIPRAAVGNSFPILISSAEPSLISLLGASLMSFPLDFVARQKVGGVNLNFFLVEQFPILPPKRYEQPAPWDPGQTICEWLLPRVLELTYTAWDLAGFASDLGYDGPPVRWDEERRALLRAEIDACFCHLYGLERDEVEYVMGTFPIVERHDIERFGEYRTERLMLASYDAMFQATITGRPYVSDLAPKLSLSSQARVK